MKYVKNSKTDIDPIQLSTVNERISMGNKLWIAAWVFEITAAIIGLLVAFYQGSDAYQNYAGSNGGVSEEQLADVILGGLPFVMVALVEVLKIPIVYLVYINRNFKTKAFFSLILVGLTFITFETVTSGFERQFTNITSKVRIPAENLRLAQDEILTLKDRITRVSVVTSKSLSEDLSVIKRNLQISYHSDIEGLEKQIDTLLATKNVVLDNEIKEAKKELEDLKASKKEELKEAKSRYATLTKERGDIGKRKRKNQQDQLDRIIAEIDKKDEKITRSIGKGLFAFCNDQCKAWKKEVKELNSIKIDMQKELSGLSQRSNGTYSDFIDIVNNKYDQKIVNIKFTIKTKRKRLQEQSINDAGVNRINTKIIAREVRYENEKIRADIHKKITEDQLKKDQSNISDWKKKVEKLEINREELLKEVSKHESLTQIYRFTKYWMNFAADKVCEEYYEDGQVSLDKDTQSGFNWFGLLQDNAVISTNKEEKVCKKYVIKEVTIADVTLENVTKTAFWWFGSLAALVSIMGIVLAFGALILKHPKEKYHDLNSKKHSIRNSIRRLLIALIRRVKMPKKEKEIIKEVIKEVPVDKVVFRDIPVEVVKKEIIHTPIYTNDPDLLKFGTSKVSDILKDDDDDDDDDDKKGS